MRLQVFSRSSTISSMLSFISIIPNRLASSLLPFFFCYFLIFPCPDMVPITTLFISFCMTLHMFLMASSIICNLLEFSSFSNILSIFSTLFMSIIVFVFANSVSFSFKLSELRGVLVGVSIASKSIRISLWSLSPLHFQGLSLRLHQAPHPIDYCLLPLLDWHPPFHLTPKHPHPQRILLR